MLNIAKKVDDWEVTLRRVKPTNNLNNEKFFGNTNWKLFTKLILMRKKNDWNCYPQNVNSFVYNLFLLFCYLFIYSSIYSLVHLSIYLFVIYFNNSRTYGLIFHFCLHVCVCLPVRLAVIISFGSSVSMFAYFYVSGSICLFSI